MHLGMLLQMAADGMGTRLVLGSRAGGVTMSELAERARRAGTVFAGRPGERVALVDLNSDAVPIALFGAALAGKPFVPINYRLADDQLRDLVRRTAPATVVVGEGIVERLGPIEGIDVLRRDELLALSADADIPLADPDACDPDAIAVLLYTSGTTGEPKAAVLRHRNLASYVISTVEFAGAGEDEAAIVSVPPYHIAGISSVLSSTYSGRRVVHVEAFEPHAWVDVVRAEGVTHAMVVPTMLNRILDVIDADGAGLPSLRALSYGGGPMPPAVIERAMALLPHVGFVNAYGLTETSSTIALLGPDDHRTAFASDDPAVRARLASVGRPLPTVEVSIRDATGEPLGPGERGEIWVRGEQVSGEYLGRNGDAGDGWFQTRDAGHLDEAGYLYVHGRLDDVIVRGGENLSPGEIESVLVEHPAVESAAVVGIPDTEWGEKVMAAVVPVAGADVSEDELRDFVRARLRSTKTPEKIDIRKELPFNETGKLLRRVLRDELAATFG
ncbi:MAG TPA: AMP-binding protein [Acidimicrobiales bacterium]|nr:AMP-binding protein [Acidimicrobiales bacterium]